MPAQPKPGRCKIVVMDTRDELVARIIEVAAQLNRPIPMVSGRDMRDPGGVTDRNINELGGIRAARSFAMQEMGEAVREKSTPKQAAKKVARKPKKPAKIKRSKRSLISGWRKVAILSDIHAPEHDRGCLTACLTWLRDTLPDVVILNGDIIELQSMSGFGGGLATLEDDCAIGNWLLDQIAEASPDSQIVYLEGNHETRLERWIERNAPHMCGITSIPLKLRLEERGIRWVPESEQPYSMGGLSVIHGHQDLSGWGPIYAARKLADLHGRPGRVLVYGHTHKHQVFDRPHSGGVARAIGLACMRSLRPGWTHGRTDAWSHQWALAHVSETSARLEMITYADGVAIHGGRAYQ